MSDDELRNQIRGSVLDVVSEIFDGAVNHDEALIVASELICMALRFADTWKLTNKELQIDWLISALRSREPIPENSWLREIPGAMEHERRRRQLETSIAQGRA